MDINATKNEKSATVSYNFGKDLNEASQMFGAGVVHSNFISKAKITAQAAMRRMLEQGLGQEEIAKKMANWKPGVAIERAAADPVASLLAAFPSMSEEQQAQLLNKLKAAKQSKG